MVHEQSRPTGYRHVGGERATGDDLVGLVTSFVDLVGCAGDPVVITAPDRQAAGLAEALPGARVLPPGPVDARPAAGVAELVRLVDQELPPDGSRLQLVSVVERPPGGWAGWMQTEALLNHVLAERPVDHLCLLGPAPGDADGAGPAAVVAGTHPWLLTGDGLRGNPRYRDPGEVVAELQQARVPDPLESTEPALALLDLDDMRSLRRAVSRVLADSPLSEDAAQDFVLAIDEIVANAAEHGIPPVDVRLWCSADRLLCSVTDRGPCFDDPLAGYGPAHGDMAVGGMGLWLARRSVDTLVAAPSGEAGTGCTVRLVVDAGDGSARCP